LESGYARPETSRVLDPYSPQKKASRSWERLAFLGEKSKSVVGVWSCNMLAKELRYRTFFITYRICKVYSQEEGSRFSVSGLLVQYVVLQGEADPFQNS
jgi:hypothetical protein